MGVVWRITPRPMILWMVKVLWIILSMETSHPPLLLINTNAIVCKYEWATAVYWLVAIYSVHHADHLPVSSCFQSPCNDLKFVIDILFIEESHTVISWVQNVEEPPPSDHFGGRWGGRYSFTLWNNEWRITVISLGFWQSLHRNRCYSLSYVRLTQALISSPTPVKESWPYLTFISVVLSEVPTLDQWGATAGLHGRPW